LLSLFNPYINLPSQVLINFFFFFYFIIIIIVVVVVVVVVVVIVLLLFIIYTINFPVVRPWSCRVIYYFDTPTLGRRHQSFSRVSFHVLATKKKCLALHVCWITNQKERRMHNFEFLRGGGVFFSSWLAAPLLFSHSFYILGNSSLYFTK